MSNQENISKETKKTRRKKSQRKAQQIKLAVIMIMVSVLVLSASTFAWYKLNNIAKIKDMQFTADTLGSLLIAEENVDTEYSDTLDLKMSQADKKYLIPVTVKNSIEVSNGNVTFYSPNYDNTGANVESVSAIAVDDVEGYVYKKVFYLKTEDTGKNKTYTLKLDEGVISDTGNSGTYVIDTSNVANNPTAANAVRICFICEDTDANTSNSLNNKIYEPNNGVANSGNDAGTSGDVESAYGLYKTIKQNSTGKFIVPSADSTTDDNAVLGTLIEGEPVKVTMYVWIEGNDDDCKSEIALNTIAGQIQFIAE